MIAAAIASEVEVDVMMSGDTFAGGEPTNNNNNNILGSERKGGKLPPSAAELLAQKSRRMAERRARVAEALYNLEHQQSSSSSSSNTDNGEGNQNNNKLTWHRMTKDELEQATLAAEQSASTLNLQGDEFGANGGKLLRRARQEMLDSTSSKGEEERKLWGNIYSDPYDPAGDLVSEATYYDKWQQAYRLIGAYIDCSNSKEGGGHSHDNNNNEQDSGQCSRWMLWAAYIDPNYAGGGYDEYFGDSAPGTLDCHSPDTDWKLIGVYRQEFYQFIEQISKHLWAVDEYEYIVARAGLKYMTDEECTSVGYDENGSALYVAVQPLEGGYWQMGLYSDDQCLILNTKTKYTYDDFASMGERNMGANDQNNDDNSQASTYWQQTQEYTLTKLNTVYNDFRFCTSCVDYPTYQDGYFIGNDGTDDEDLINQCWKFYSHNSYNCDSDCLAMAAEQDSISWISYNGKQFGTLIDGQYDKSHDKSSLGEASVVSSANGAHRIERLKANLFLTFAGVVFVSTFLAFAVARGSSKKKKSSRSRSRRLLDADYGGGDRDERRSKSRSQSRSSRRISSSDRDRDRGDPEARSKSKSRSSRSKSQSGRTVTEYEPPTTSSSLAEEKKKRSQSRSRTGGSSSRRVAEM